MNVDTFQLQGDEVINCDVCIVGSGAAGMTIACELEGSDIDVVLLDAGGTKYDAELQETLRGEVAEGSVHYPPDMYRRRILGGATTIWGGRCVPLSPIDLEHRDYVPYSGWPISWDELERYYPAAQTYCEAGHYAYDVVRALGDAAHATISDFAEVDVEASQIERFSPPTDFGRTYWERIARSGNVRVLLHAKAIRLQEAGRIIAKLEAEGGGTRRLTVHARHYVLAMGGLETPRLLMTSDVTRRGGIGNDGGALGRFYMCHMENTFGLLRLCPQTRPVMFGIERAPEGVYVCRKFTISAAAQRREKLLNTTARPDHPLISDPKHRNGVLSAMYLAKGTTNSEYRRKLAIIEIARRDTLLRDYQFWAAHLTNIGLDGVTVARFGIDWLRQRTFARRKLPFVAYQSPDGTYPLDVNAEQIPDPANAVTLSSTYGPDGLRQIRVNWRPTDQDVDSLFRTTKLMSAAFAQTDCGTLEFDEAELMSAIRSSTPVGGHHIGTARMANCPAYGVVDRHCKVYGLENLHLAGSAVFPTCGHANPTLTIVALSIRLSERLMYLIKAKPAAGHLVHTQAA